MKRSSELRELFLSFFERHQHRRVASHSLIPPADPSLLFVNAGMVQFKDIFTGNRAADYKRAASSQKCLRVSGKHNDLENVGRTARHHTFFEMLGNFSFGDYFKQDAIRFAYDFLVKEVGLDPARCYYTIFGGDADDGLEPDLEAEGYWAETAGIPRDKVLRFGKKDNFWAMGETGPCGPCSEILYDRGPGPWACGRPECEPGCDCDRFVEIWNLVFMQYVRHTPGGALEPLPAPSIDTGMGLERLAAIVQQKGTNYDTDLFLPLIQFTVQQLAKEAGRTVEYPSGTEDDVALRVIADHCRAAAFLVADGVYPDNEGRGYITRLLVRRAVRFGRKLGFARPFFHHVCNAVVDHMRAAYPDLEQRRDVIRQVISREEEVFNQTYDEGARALEQELARLRDADTWEVGGEFLFWLHDERGLQPDLVDVIAREQGFTIDRAGYDRLMAKKREASGRAGHEETDPSLVELKAFAAQSGPDAFLGYDREEGTGTVRFILDETSPRQELTAGQSGRVVLDATPFYAEAGGQVGDTGRLDWDGGRAVVHNTRRGPGDLHVHEVTVEEGTLRLRTTVGAAVDGRRRAGIRAHHSATHLLHWALEKVLGDHVKQEGSLVKEDLLRFDFRHFSPLTHDEIERIEAMVADRVLANTPVETAEMPLEEAVASGAKAFFDEKYEQNVRVVAMGDVSRELCGGTHARRTGDIGFLKVTRQEAVSSGVRRIYAVCNQAFVDVMAQQERRLVRLQELLKTGADELEVRVEKLLETNARLEKETRALEQKLLSGAAAGTGGGAQQEKINGVSVAWSRLESGQAGKVRTMADVLRDKLGEGIVLVGAEDGGRLTFVIARTAGAGGTFHCGHAVRELAGLMEGRGGGKPDFGQAGGCRPDLWDRAVARFKELVAES